MRLLHFGPRGEVSLTTYLPGEIPPYAILSHTWGADCDEVTFTDLQRGSGKSKAGYAKIVFCGQQAQKDGLEYYWMDTCCIDRTSSTELQEAITSMFDWYRNAAKCYAYLSDVSVHADFRSSRWFTRGWTLQELIAPESVEFFSRDQVCLGDKKMLEREICEITGIPTAALHRARLSDFSVGERMGWAAKRDTQRKEDKAYCLLGIFEVFMPLMYGEGEDHALNRLKEEIDKRLRKLPYALDDATLKSLSDLQATNPKLDMERIEGSKDPLLKDCYEWILNDPVLREWRDGDSSSLLWICGDPGKGKTMLMIALARELLNASEKSSIVTFFFCQNTDFRLNTAHSILRGLIWKLAVDHPHLAGLFRREYESNKHQLNGPNAIYAFFSILSVMLDHCSSTFLLIDALDECNHGPERDSLLKLITKHAKSSSKIKWLITSRNNPEIMQALETEGRTLSLELNEQHISKAVHSFIHQKVGDLAADKKYSPDLRRTVVTELINRADSTFLWVALACQELHRVARWKTLSTLKKLPPGLEGLYTQMMDQVLQVEDEEERDFCLQILRSVCLAFRPLSLEELATMAELPTELDDNDRFELIKHCGSFIILRSGFLYFVHQSAKDYLVAGAAQKLFSTTLQEEHGIFLSRSLNAMSKILRRNMYNLEHPGSSSPSASTDTPLQAVSYACSFWVEHLTTCMNGSTDGLRYEAYLMDRGRVHNFLLSHLLHWFEALSLMQKASDGVRAIISLEATISAKESPDLHKFIRDAKRFALYHRPAIEEAPLQVYCSALVFSPELSLVRKQFTSLIPKWIHKMPKVQKDWSALQQTLEGHTHAVNALAFSPDGKQLASASSDDTVRLWDPATGTALQTLKGHTSAVSAVAFSPDGKQLASASYDRTVRLWDPATGTMLQTLKGHTGTVYTVAFSPDGKQLASASADDTVRLWDPATGTVLQTLKGHTSTVSAVAFSPDGKQLASASYDRTIRLWDSATGTALQTLKGHTHAVRAVAFSPDGKQLASASYDNTVRLWDPATGAALQTLEGHTGAVYAVAFSPDGKQLASASYGRIVRLWNPATGTALQTLKGHTSTVNAVAFSPDGKQLASASYDRTVRLWDPATCTALQTLKGHTGKVYAVAFSPDGKRLASASHDDTVRLWDPATGTALQTLRGHTDTVYAVAFSPDGKQLASASFDDTVRLWNPATGAVLQTLRGHTNAANAVAFSPDGKQLASASHDNTVRLWDPATGTALQTLKGHTGTVYTVAFSPDGKQLASASYDRTVRLWDAATGMALQRLRGHTDTVNAVAFSPDGKQLASASADGTVKLWDLATGTALQTLKGHTSTVSAVAFSPDGKQLASASADRTVRLWDPATGTTCGMLQTNVAVRELRFSADGQSLDTDRGRLDFKTLSHDDISSPSTPRRGIFVDGAWIIQGMQKILWLPSDYRATCASVHHQVLAIGHSLGHVSMLEIDY